MVAGSILPIAIHENKIYFLFGKENPLEDSSKGWSDFGGGTEKGENPFETALREGSEELTGFLGDKKQIQKLIRKSGGIYEVVVNDYHVHIFLMEYDPNLPTYYNNNHAFLWKRMDKKELNETRLFEKIEIKWFSENELNTKRKLFRHFYQTIVGEIQNQLPQIREFANKKNTNNKTRKMRGGK